MINPSLPFSLHEFTQSIAEGYVTGRRHDEYPYTIYNYSKKTQYENKWNSVTTNCRGLILDDNLKIIARGFKKFFNLGQEGAPTPSKSDLVSVADKLDGSLGVIFPTPDGKHAVATRGSFHSEQAEHATQVWLDRYEGEAPIPENHTMVVEICYPENRIVLDYQGLDDLILIGAVPNDPLSDDFIHAKDIRNWTGPVVKNFGTMTFEEALSLPARQNAEGLVLYHRDGLAKIKQPDYLELHRLRFNMNPRRIWESLSSGRSLEDIVAPLPDEFQDEIKSIAIEITNRFSEIYTQVTEDYAKIEPTDDKKEFAQRVRDRRTEHPSAMFLLHNNRDINPYIWKLIKPKGDSPQ